MDFASPVCPVAGAGNYVIARMLWDPEQDTFELLNEYYRCAYGEKVAGRQVLFLLQDQAG